MIAVENGKNKNVPWKKPQKTQTFQIESGKSIKTPKHPRERKKFLEQQMAKKNSKAILSKTFDFDPQEYLNKSLLFNLNKDRWGKKIWFNPWKNTGHWHILHWT